MFDDQVIPEVTPEQQPVAVEAQPEAPKTQQVLQSDLDTKEANMRALRERAEHERYLREQTERRLYYLEQRMQQPAQPVVQEEDIGVDDDSYVEGKHVKKMRRQIQETKAQLLETRKQLEQQAQQAQSSVAEIRLRSQFTDFDNVVSTHNIKRLAELKPSLYRSVMANPDLYDKGVTAYEMIKNSGIISETYAQDRRLEENRSKPRAMANAAPQSAETPLTRVGDYDRRILTEERKKQLLRDVARYKM